jgi:hypothetical protein
LTPEQRYRTSRSANALTITFTLLVIVLLCAAMLALAGCATPIAATPSSERVVYQAEASFAAALRLAVTYEALPDCATGVTLCSSAPLRHKLNTAAHAARASLSTAEALVRSHTGGEQVGVLLGQATKDVAQFQALAGALSQ